MKSFLCLFALVLLVETATAKHVHKKYSRFLEYPDNNGVKHKIDLEEKLNMKVLNEVTRNPTANQYFLFTRKNPTTSHTLEMNDANSVTSSNFNAKISTVVIVHGWLGNKNTDINPTIRDAFLNKSDVNVIVVDWSRLALYPYNTAAYGVPAIGRGVGQFLAFVNNVTGASYKTMHLVGFSLGAHIVGNAGRELGGRVARITGLDPAGPLWSTNSNRLSPNDAEYVEAIHTNGDILGLGIESAVANADFFPNGGKSQPGCTTPTCNHNRAWEIFASSVTNNHFIGKKCENMREVHRNNCNGAKLHMGNDDLNKTGNGLFRLNTQRSYPF